MKHLFLTAVFLLSVFCVNAQNLTVESQYPGDASALKEYQVAVEKQSSDKTSATRTTWLSSRPGSDWFISLEGGVSQLMSENYENFPFEKNLKPTGGINFGKWFSPVWGLRFGLSGGTLSSYLGEGTNPTLVGLWYGPKGANHYFNPASTQITSTLGVATEKRGEIWYQDFSYATASLDFMVNLKNLFRPYNPKGFFNPVLYGGFGYARTLGKDFDPFGIYKDYKGNKDNIGSVDNLVGQAGLQLNFRLCDAFDLYLAAEGLLVPENFDRILGGTDTYEGVVSAKLGLTYHFNFRHFIKAPLYDQSIIDDLNRQINDLRNAKPATVVCPPVPVCPPCPKVEAPVVSDPQLEPVFFLLDSHVVRDNQLVNVAKAAEYLISHPSAKLELASYADKKTGNPKYNLQLSKKRSDAVANVLVNKFGIDKKRLTVKYFGDTVQPYSENDYNRVTIFVK